MTIESIRTIMKLTEQQMAALLKTTGISADPRRILSDEEIKKLRLALLRSYQSTPSVASKPAPAPRPEPTSEPVPEPVSKPAAPVVPVVAPVPKKPEVPVDPQMEQLVLEKKIMIDTCSLMHDQCGCMIQRLLPALQKHGRQVLIPDKVIGELQKHRNSSDPVKSGAARQGMRLCRQLQEAGCLSIRGDQRDNFADNTFFVAISRYRYQHQMLLITQDRKLSQDILFLNQMKSSQGHPVTVMYLDRAGNLRPSHGI